MGRAALRCAVPSQGTIPFGTLGANDRNTASRHPRSLFRAGIELGDLLPVIEEKPCECGAPGVDNDKVARRPLVLRVCVRTRRLAAKALAHGTILPRAAKSVRSANRRHTQCTQRTGGQRTRCAHTLQRLKMTHSGHRLGVERPIDRAFVER